MEVFLEGSRRGILTGTEEKGCPGDGLIYAYNVYYVKL